MPHPAGLDDMLDDFYAAKDQLDAAETALTDARDRASDAMQVVIDATEQRNQKQALVLEKLNRITELLGA